MFRLVTLLVLIIAVAPLSAQKISLAPKAADKAQVYTIQSKSTVQTKMEMLRDGEPMTMPGGRRFGGDQGMPTTTEQKLIIEEGPLGSQWRRYKEAKASVTYPGRDGEQQTREVISGLVGKKLHLTSEDGRVIVRQNDAMGEEINRRQVGRVPAKIEIAGLFPAEPQEVDREFDLSKTFRNALKTFVHPITPAANPDQAARGERGQRGERGERGQRNARDRFARFARSRPVRDTVLNNLVNDKLPLKVKGKILKVEKVGNEEVAHIALEGVIDAKGSPTELGMMNRMSRFGGRRGGRRGQQDGGEEPAKDTNKATAKVTFKGHILFNCTQKSFKELSIKGDLATSSEINRSTRRGDLETKTQRKGTFELMVRSAPAPTK